MKKDVIVIGLGKFGASVAEEIEKLRGEVLAIDRRESEVKKIADKVTRCAVCDATSIEVLRELGAEKASAAVIAIGDNLQASVLTLMNLKELGVQKVIVRVSDRAYEPIFNRLGADKLVIPEEASGVTLAHSLISRNVADYYQIGGRHSIVRLKVGEKFEKKTLVDMDSRNRYDVNIIGIFRGGEFVIPKASDTVEPGDELLVVGENNRITRFDYYVNRV